MKIQQVQFLLRFWDEFWSFRPMWVIAVFLVEWSYTSVFIVSIMASIIFLRSDWSDRSLTVVYLSRSDWPIAYSLKTRQCRYSSNSTRMRGEEFLQGVSATMWPLCYWLQHLATCRGSISGGSRRWRGSESSCWCCCCWRTCRINTRSYNKLADATILLQSQESTFNVGRHLVVRCVYSKEFRIEE